ncbi:hypothetical protein [Brevibacillus formosus]|uniref:hypothetical protein n=1 Tax=Brevibacillus formosus TaxID=54913 RepID=UPI003F53D925
MVKGNQLLLAFQHMYTKAKQIIVPFKAMFVNSDGKWISGTAIPPKKKAPYRASEYVFFKPYYTMSNWTGGTEDEHTS